MEAHSARDESKAGGKRSGRLMAQHFHNVVPGPRSRRAEGKVLLRTERASQVIVAPEGLMLTRKSGRSCGSAEDRYSAQNATGPSQLSW